MPCYDMAVIGAGLVGCAAAFELALRGRRVAVFDQAEVNRGASGRNAGSLHFQLEPRMVEAVSDPHLLAQIVPVNLQAIEDWRRLPERLHRPLELLMHGGIMVAESEDECGLLARKVELESRAGLEVRLVEGAELRRLAPYLSRGVRCASFCAEEGHANPRLVTPAYAAAARELGVVFRCGVGVRKIEPRAGGWRLIGQSASASGAGGSTAAIAEVERILVAAGAWSRELLEPLGVPVPLRPVALSMNVTERCTPLVHHLVQHVGRRLSVKQVEAGNILIGGGWSAALPGGSVLGSNPTVDLREQSLIGNAAIAIHVVPALAGVSLLRSWTGIASVSPDHLPVLGPVDGLPGVFIAAGGSSFTLGPTYARLVSELMDGRTPSMSVQCYRPSRFARS